MALSAKNCPICDQMNQCMMASGQDISTCWCVLSDYSAVELIKRYQLAYPQASINKEQCVCQSCLAQMARMSLPALPVVQIFKPSI
jgi:hypothetical protein